MDAAYLDGLPEIGELWNIRVNWKLVPGLKPVQDKWLINPRFDSRCQVLPKETTNA